MRKILFSSIFAFLLATTPSLSKAQVQIEKNDFTRSELLSTQEKVLSSLYHSKPQSTPLGPSHDDIRDGLLLAQDGFDAYDPFADYSEFNEASDEEADIYFLRNGRFFTLGLVVGYRMFTGNMGQIYTAAPNFGILISYFFDLRFALQMSYITGDHNYSFSANGTKYEGNLTVSGFSFDIKYFMNVQNVTKGLSSINPYVFGGLSQLTRNQTSIGSIGSEKDTAMGFQVGIGSEFPMMKNKVYIGVEALYQYVNFPGEGKPIVSGTNLKLSGDIVRFQTILGFNF